MCVIMPQISGTIHKCHHTRSPSVIPRLIMDLAMPRTWVGNVILNMLHNDLLNECMDQCPNIPSLRGTQESSLFQNEPYYRIKRKSAFHICQPSEQDNTRLDLFMVWLSVTSHHSALPKNSNQQGAHAIPKKRLQSTASASHE
jgi:hypothetical protein